MLTQSFGSVLRMGLFGLVARYYSSARLNTALESMVSGYVGGCLKTGNFAHGGLDCKRTRAFIIVFEIKLANLLFNNRPESDIRM